jgi:hypothetical protein
MNISVSEPVAISISFDSDRFWVELSDGRQLGVPLAYFPRLANASRAELENSTISGGGQGLHWESLDEDISVQGLLAGRMTGAEIPYDPIKKAA